jgi:Zn-dependent peptidase ImmA (M78 family)/transcriptional regulator with XRE-family HTH domain
MTRVEATPTPSVLIWARKTAGMSAEAAARRAAVKVEQLLSWEDGATRPSISQLRKLASAFHRPLAVFYLPEPPTRFQVMQDFRRLSTETLPPESSPKLAYEIRRAFDRREWTLELMENIDESPPMFQARATNREGVEQVANRLRATLGVSVPAQSSWRGDYEAFKHWRLLLERAGILTLQATDIQLKEARGFSISLKPLPVVVVNIKDAPRGRIFTLLHETTHVMLNEGGVCDLHDADVEAFCNRIAGAALFPEDELLNTGTVQRHKKGDPAWTDEELQEISRHFGGSREAALVRLLTLQLTTQAYYDRMKDVFRRQYEQQQKEREKSAGFAPPHVIAISSAGPLFTGLVVESLNREKITASDVSDYLQIRLKHLKDLQGEFSKEA